MDVDSTFNDLRSETLFPADEATRRHRQSRNLNVHQNGSGTADG